MMSSKILRLAGDSEVKLLVLVMLVTAFIGAFVSNTGTVALMMPIIVSMAMSGNINSSRLLMPMAFASSMGGMIGDAKLPKQNVGVLPVMAVLEDFDFDLKLQVNEFKVFIPGQPSIAVKGGKFNEQARAAVARAKRGDKIQVFDIKASIPGNSNLKLPPVSPIIIEITN